MGCLVLPLETVRYNQLAQAEQEYNAARQDLATFRSARRLRDPLAMDLYLFLVERRDAARLRYYGLL